MVDGPCGKTTCDTWMDGLNTCFKSGTGSSFSSFESSSHNSTCRAASYCGPYSTGNTSYKWSLVFYLEEALTGLALNWEFSRICLTWKKYALSTGSFSRLWTSAMKVDSVVFTSASLSCHKHDSFYYYCYSCLDYYYVFAAVFRSVCLQCTYICICRRYR